MAIKRSDTDVVLKIDIANALRQTGSAPSYSNESAFQKFLRTKPKYTAKNIKSLFNYAVYINKESFNETIFCKPISIPSNGELTAGIDVSARFDSLSSIFLNASLPLTNIRKSNFVFLTEKNGTIREENITDYAALADNAILAKNAQSFANNTNATGKKLITNANDFLLCGGILSDLITLRNRLVVKEYIADTDDVDPIAVETISTLSTCFIRGLTKIADDLSCRFYDGNREQMVRLTYHSEPNGGSSNVKEVIRNTDTTVLDYKDVFGTPGGNRIFSGWSTNKSSNTVSYEKGARIRMDKNKNLYPVFKPQAKVVYQGAAQYGLTKSFSVEVNINLNTPYTVKSFASLNVGTFGDGWTFKGWTTRTATQTVKVTHAAGSTITVSKAKIVYLNPVVAKITANINSKPTLKVINWDSIAPAPSDPSALPLDSWYDFPKNPLSLSRVFKDFEERLKLMGKKLPSLDLLVGIRISDGIFYGSSNDSIDVSVKMPDDTKWKFWWSDYYGPATVQSDGVGVIVWQPNNDTVKNKWTLQSFLDNDDFGYIGSDQGSVLTYNKSYTDAELKKIKLMYVRNSGNAYAFFNKLAFIDYKKSVTETTTFKRVSNP